DVNLSLFTGGLLAVGTSFIFHIRQGQPRVKSMKVAWEGIKTMIPAIYILLLAWMIGSIIGTLKTGEYLAQLVHDASLGSSVLPLLFFLFAGLMALATGASWGTLGIMITIAPEVAIIHVVNILLPSLEAVLAG